MRYTLLDAPVPPRWHPCRWRITFKLSMFLYVSGISSGGGGVSWHSGDGPFYRLPPWSSVLPKRGHSLRPYVLWLPDWWWQCHWRQGWKLWRHHRPETPFTLGVCAACVPCPECDAHYDCECYR